MNKTELFGNEKYPLNVFLRNGLCRYIIETKLFQCYSGNYFYQDNLESYNEDLTSAKNDREFDIMKVCSANNKLIWKRKETPLVSETEYRVLKTAYFLGHHTLYRTYGGDIGTYRSNPDTIIWTGFNDLFEFIEEDDRQPQEKRYNILELMKEYEKML